MGYKLFIADFDESESEVLSFESLEEVSEHLDGWCDDCEDYKGWFRKLRDKGFHCGEWHHYHLIEV